MDEYGFEGDEMVAIEVYGGKNCHTDVNAVFALAEVCFGDVNSLDKEKLYNSLRGDSYVSIAIARESKQLVGYLSTSMDKEGILEVGWLLVLPGFLEGGLAEMMLTQLCVNTENARGIRSGFLPMLYKGIYKDIGMLYNSNKSCYELIEMS